MNSEQKPPEQAIDDTPQEGNDQAAADVVEYSVSGGLLARLASLNISIAFSSYQSGLLYLIGRNREGGINVHQAGMPKPMGLCMEDDGSLTMTAGFLIMRFENVLEANQQINNQFDACYVPRTVHVTGHLDAHDVGVDKQGRPIFINTRFNCLATVSNHHSFEVLWKPPFISALVDEDRCHLNGLAMQDGVPRYVTAVSRSDTIDGWRDRRGDGGIVIDVESNEIVCTGLSMPHSPRMHNGELWLLNSGTGELGVVNFDPDGKGSFEPRVFCPGFLRGLAFHGNLAFVGLSKPRYKRFEGLELDQRLRDADSEPWCGFQIIDLTSGSCVDWLRIDGKIGELYDLEVISGVATPMAVAPDSQEAAGLVTFAVEGQP
ncbi:MAG: TIGR03032 family protein [Gammaproteobacteria bacterium]|nr:TIGR03032 family protein [Gammaproteobacteria bacterium]